MRLTTSAASILLGRTACGAGADTEAEGRVSFPDALPDPADHEVGCREVTSAALTFLLLNRVGSRRARRPRTFRVRQGCLPSGWPDRRGRG